MGLRLGLVVGGWPYEDLKITTFLISLNECQPFINECHCNQLESILASFIMSFTLSQPSMINGIG